MHFFKKIKNILKKYWHIKKRVVQYGTLHAVMICDDYKVHWKVNNKQLEKKMIFIQVPLKKPNCGSN